MPTRSGQQSAQLPSIWLLTEPTSRESVASLKSYNSSLLAVCLCLHLIFCVRKVCRVSQRKFQTPSGQRLIQSEFFRIGVCKNVRLVLLFAHTFLPEIPWSLVALFGSWYQRFLSKSPRLSSGHIRLPSLKTRVPDMSYLHETTLDFLSGVEGDTCRFLFRLAQLCSYVRLDPLP